MELRKITHPSRSSNLRKGFFAPSGLPKPLPLGEVALRSNDGEGKDADKQLLHCDSIALTKSLLIAVQRL